MWLRKWCFEYVILVLNCEVDIALLFCPLIFIFDGSEDVSGRDAFLWMTSVLFKLSFFAKVVKMTILPQRMDLLIFWKGRLSSMTPLYILMNLILLISLFFIYPLLRSWQLSSTWMSLKSWIVHCLRMTFHAHTRIHFEDLGASAFGGLISSIALSTWHYINIPIPH